MVRSLARNMIRRHFVRKIRLPVVDSRGQQLRHQMRGGSPGAMPPESAAVRSGTRLLLQRLFVHCPAARRRATSAAHDPLNQLRSLRSVICIACPERANRSDTGLLVMALNPAASGWLAAAMSSTQTEAGPVLGGAIVCWAGRKVNCGHRHSTGGIPGTVMPQAGSSASDAVSGLFRTPQ